MDVTLRGLLGEIIVSPMDPTPKLVLADYLEDEELPEISFAVRWMAHNEKWPYRVPSWQARSRLPMSATGRWAWLKTNRQVGEPIWVRSVRELKHPVLPSELFTHKDYRHRGCYVYISLAHALAMLTVRLQQMRSRYEPFVVKVPSHIRVVRELDQLGF